MASNKAPLSSIGLPNSIKSALTPSARQMAAVGCAERARLPDTYAWTLS